MLFDLVDGKYLVVCLILVVLLKNVLLKEKSKNIPSEKTQKTNSEINTKNQMSSPVVANLKQIIASSKIFVAHKSYCPHCHATLKTLLQDKKVPESEIKLLELDTLENGAELQDALQEISGQRSVPNIYISGKHIGGNSDLQALDKQGKLDDLLKKALA